MVRRTDRPAMTIAVDLGCKATKKNNLQNKKSRNTVLNSVKQERWYLYQILLIYLYLYQ